MVSPQLPRTQRWQWLRRGVVLGLLAAAAATTLPVAAQNLSPATRKAYEAGAAALQEGDFEAARTHFEEAVERLPSFLQAWKALADVYLQLSEAEKSDEAARKVLELKPADPAAVVLRYAALFEMGRTADDPDFAAVRSAVLTAGGSPELARRVFNRGAEVSRTGDDGRALTHFEEALILDPQLLPAHAAKVRMLLQAGEVAAAQTAVERYLELAPTDATALGLAEDVRNRAAEPELPPGMELPPEPEPAPPRAPEAEPAEAATPESGPENTAPAGPGDRDEAQKLHAEGVRLFDARDSAGAKTALEAAVAADPTFPRAWYTLGLVCLDLGEEARARESLETFIRLAPDDPEVGAADELLSYLE